jgi:hypothetical protein
VLDFSAQGQVVGVEILGLSKRAAKVDLQRLIFETTGPAPVIAVREDEPPYPGSKA